MTTARRNKKTALNERCWNTIGVWGRSTEKCPELDKYTHCRNCPVFAEASHSVFEKVAPSGYLTQWKKEISARAAIQESKKNSVLVFRVHNEWFAFPAKVLNEVANERTVHRIPRNMNRFVSGVTNINGEISICYSLKELLGISDIDDYRTIEAKKPKRLVVISLSDVSYVFCVDEVKGLCWFSDAELNAVPSTLSENNSHLLLGSFDQSGNCVAVLNMSNFQERLERAVL
jgi:chemotaxis-related protein WspD